LTENLGAVVETLKALKPGVIRPGGTDLAAGLASALDAFDDQDHAEGRSVVLFSDGEDHVNAWKSALERVATQGVVVHTVAVGDAEAGHPVPSGSRPGGGGGSESIQYKGQVVLSKRIDAPLEAIANETGGAVLRLGLASTDLGALYRDRIEPEVRARRSSSLVGEPAERFAVFLLAGLTFLLFGFWPRRARLRLPSPWLMVPFVVLVIVSGSGADEQSAGRLVEDGRVAYNAGRYDAAADLFEKALQLRRDDAVLHYNTAAALFQLGRFDDASRHYLEARDRADAGLKTKIDYALGNTALSQGDFVEAIRHYDNCLGSTVRGAAFDAVRQDAEINRAYVVEQAKRSLTPPDDPSDPTSKPSEPKKSSGKNGDRSGQPSPGNSGSAPGQNPGDPANPGPRGTGGAWGSGPTPPEAGGAGDQLAKAMENVREARKRRIDPPSAAAGTGDSKDW
jgi:Ca-activated chloride channel family protein